MSVKLGTIISGAVLVAYSVTLLPAFAAQITEREKRDCPRDYHAYCGEYGLGSEALRACMSRNIKKVSNACVAALVDAGEMTQAQADKLKGGKPKVTSSKKTSKKKVAYKSSKKKKTH